jgi:hypothetical protein
MHSTPSTVIGLPVLHDRIPARAISQRHWVPKLGKRAAASTLPNLADIVIVLARLNGKDNCVRVSVSCAHRSTVAQQQNRRVGSVRHQQQSTHRRGLHVHCRLDWQFAGVASVHGAGASHLVLHNVNAGFFEVYDIANI